MAKLILALSIICGVTGTFGSANAVSTFSLESNDNCEVNYLDGQLVKCCPDITGRWHCVPVK